MTPSASKATWRRDDFYRFLRPNFFVFTAMLVILGAAASNPRPDLVALSLLVAFAFSFHVFAYVENDVLDLPIDRTQPLRANDPLVRGLISPTAAMTLAVAQVPAGFLITRLLDGNVWSYLVLAVAYVCMTLYNVLGKRCAVPMITDAVQGVSWGSLAMYSSLVAGGQVNAMSWVAASFGFGFLFLINGIHGGLRDLRNDLAAGCKTTAIYFGAYPDPDGQGVICTPALKAYAFFAMAVYVAPATVALASGQFGYKGYTLIAVWSAWVVIHMVSVWILHLMTERKIANRNLILRYQGLPVLVSAVIIFLPTMGPALLVALLASYYIPLMVFEEWDIEWARWLISSIRTTSDQTQANRRRGD